MRSWLTLLLLAGAALPAQACFTVYGPGGRVLYHALEPPVDMRGPLHETLPLRFPQGHLVFGNEQDCPSADPIRPPRAGGTPLLTDRASAEALGRPQRSAGEAALVPGAGPTVRPGVVVAVSPFAPPPRSDPADDDTRRMGGPPARPRTAAEVIRAPLPQGVMTLDAGR
jgi:hypothetical protein